MTTTKWAVLIIIVGVSVWFGMVVGERDYRASCEPVGNAQGQRWLECNK